ncbi:hypothetical protein, partial [Aureimonas sp. Leaf324]|uniref:hypothetical protein n=1 Tax=Aureimonas sp. Leaf324 TaxID=1736336 RepID=UPI001AEBA7D7
ISSGLGFFLGILGILQRLKSLLQGGPLFRGQTRISIRLKPLFQLVHKLDDPFAFFNRHSGHVFARQGLKVTALMVDDVPEAAAVVTYRITSIGHGATLRPARRSDPPGISGAGRIFAPSP